MVETGELGVWPKPPSSWKDDENPNRPRRRPVSMHRMRRRPIKHRWAAPGPRWSVWIIGAALSALAGGLYGTTALATSLSPPQTSSCYNPSAPYAYGATDANSESGNSSLTALFAANGTLTVLRSLAANDDNQVNFFASSYDAATGQPQPAEPNQGAFIGVRYLLDGAPSFAWLRSWPSTQRYLNGSTPIVLTSYAGPSGISVSDEAFATAGPLSTLDPALSSAGPDALVQRLTVSLSSASSVTDVALVAYGNWNPVATAVPYAPLADSGCTAYLNEDKVAVYNPTAQAVVVSWSGVNASTHKMAASAVAFGWSGGTEAWQVGGDSTDSTTPPTDPTDAYRELSSSPYILSDDSTSVGQTTGATMAALALEPGTSASLALLTTAAATPQAALDQLAAARQLPMSSELSMVENSWTALLARAATPNTSDAAIVSAARRTLMTVLLAVDPRSGAIIASPNTQGPYGEDWIRDGAFINAMLDQNGFTSIVTRHEFFYARTQSSPANPVPTTPFGNWPMVMYPSGGGPGGPIPYEIDETGYGAWTLYDHAAYLSGAAAGQYLEKVFPAIARAADWLTVCQDPQTGLPCPANTGDNYEPGETLQAAGPVLLGLRSAIAAAGQLGIDTSEVAQWRARTATLEAAIDASYDPSTQDYRRDPSQLGPGSIDDQVTGQSGYENGGALLWPVQLHSFSDPRMQGEAAAVYSSMEASFSASSGGYEGAQLLGVCRAWTPLTPTRRSALAHALDQILATTATSTGLLGEYWQRWGDGTVTPLNDIPHTWESALFDMSALCVYGSS